MKKLMVIICLLAITAGAVEKKQLTEAERAARREEMIKRTGGPIKLPPTGFVALVDMQSKAAHDKLAEKFAKTFEGFGFATKAIKSDAVFQISDLSTKTKEIGAGSVVFVIDNPDYPMSLVSIETRAGLVNVAALAKDNPSSTLLTRRACKMIGRISMLASGGAESASPTSDLQPVTTLHELDQNEGQGDEVYVLMGVIAGMAKAGVTAERRMTYLQACKAGLAPAPTNDVQKAIWDKVHELPTKPITIEPEKAPVKK